MGEKTEGALTYVGFNRETTLGLQLFVAMFHAKEKYCVNNSWNDFYIIGKEKDWLYVIIMSRTSFRVNLHSVVCLNVKELFAWSRCHIWSLSDNNGIQTHNHLIHKQTLNHLAKWASLAKWLSVCLRTKGLGVRIPMLSLRKIHI